VDWLRVADQGVTADFLGGLLFHLLLEELGPGATDERVKRLWARIRALYRELGSADKLHRLTPKMIRQQRKWAKLRCSAAQARCLVPVAERLARDLLRPAEVPEHEAALAAVGHLAECYAALRSAAGPHPKVVLERHGRMFATYMAALEDRCGTDSRWRCKPKLHLWLHLTAAASRPALTWTFRDEDWGGFAARLSRRRGGHSKPLGLSRSTLARFCLKTQMPRVR
jgi:hypothetical protein